MGQQAKLDTIYREGGVDYVTEGDYLVARAYHNGRNGFDFDTSDPDFDLFPTPVRNVSLEVANWLALAAEQHRLDTL